MKKNEAKIGCLSFQGWLSTVTDCRAVCYVLFLILFCLLSPSADLFADNENVVVFRKIFAPEHMIDSLSLEPGIPMDRLEFESWIERLNQQSENQNEKQPYLSRIVLKAKLEGRQLVSGQGFFTLPSRSKDTKSIPLHPLTLAINTPHWQDTSEAVLFCESGGENRLLVPAATDSLSYDHLQFQWSLQSRKDQNNGIVFDLALPPCLSIELQIDLPQSLMLTTSAGLVFPDERTNETESEFQPWRVFLGHHSNTTLTITPNKAIPSIKRKSAFRQSILYTVSQQCLEVRTRINFDTTDPLPEKLLLELESPLRPFDVKYGDQPAAWTRSAISTNVTEIQIDLSPFTNKQPQELVIESLGPLLENQHWILPRIRVTSPDIFWTETRCGVRVMTPLRTRNIACDRAVQVIPNNTDNWAIQETHVFQFFQDDAQVELEVMYSTPPFTVSSVVQTNWSDMGIRGTVFLDCRVTEGERFILDFPIANHWIIDDVTACPLAPQETKLMEDDLLFLWDLLDDGKTLSVHLNRPLTAQHRVTLKLSCRLINSSQTQFRLTELFPLLLSYRGKETHYIALQFDSTAHTLNASVDASTFDIPRGDILDACASDLIGNIYPLDSRTKDIHFELERTRPNYAVEFTGNMYVDHSGLTPTYRIRCTPSDSSISRILVHFTPFTKNHADENWIWTLVGHSNPSNLFRVRKMPYEELAELLPIFEQQNRSDVLESGGIWEVRFEEPQTMPFELLAESLIPLEDSMQIPFASVPLAATQRGELTIESPQQFNYRIVGAKLDSVPIASPEPGRYRSVRAAFRYDPQDELRLLLHTPLMMEKTTAEKKVPTAWVWSLRLDSQYEPEGLVRHKALFLVENQGKDSLQIKLPREINATNISTVWQDSQQISWKSNTDQKTIDVVLPVGQRFVSIAVEYTHKGVPLVQQRKLQPHYPTVDVPVLVKNWISWFPPEFNVSLRHATPKGKTPESPFVISKALDYLLTGTYRSFLGLEWDNALHGKRRRSETDRVTRHLFEEIVNIAQQNSTLTWGKLLGNERILSGIRSRLSDPKRVVETKLLIDKQAFTFLGISPDTPIENTDSIQNENVRERLLGQAGLVLLIATRTRSDGIKEYVFALSTATTLALNRQFHATPSGHCVRIVPYEIFESDSKSLPEWIPAARWILETTLSPIPWSVSAQAAQRSTLVTDWYACELPMNIEQSLYIVHRQKYLAIQWIAFLSAVLITCRKPFSSPLLLIALMIIFESIARSVAPCYIGIPSGALLGVLVSFAFGLIRSQVIPCEVPLNRLNREESTECSESFVPTPLPLRSWLLCCLIAGLSAPTLAQDAQEPIQPPTQKEPYRVFYPTDNDRQIIGEHVWVPLEFRKQLGRNVNTDNDVASQQGKIIKAVYQGSLVRGTSGLLECSDDFKVVYDIYLDTSNATIMLPRLPAVPGKFLWNSRPIQPNWANESIQNTLSFSIENETPGKHTLEIALSPVNVHDGDETSLINFAIPKVAHSTLRLNVPLNSPMVNVPDAQGAVMVNTALTPVVTAELGAAEQLVLTWTDNPNRNGTLVNEVEQFFWIRAKPSQIELWTLFRFRIDGGKIQHLTIQTDPRWVHVGQFRCEEGYQIRSETFSNSLDTLTDPTYNVSRISFQSPVAGTLTLRAEFVFGETNRDTNVFRNLRLPAFATPQSRITKSMLGISSDPLLELNLPTEGRDSGFEAGWYDTTSISSSLINSLWGFGELLVSRDNATRERPDVGYDLTKTEPGWTVNIRPKKTVPNVTVTQSMQFDVNESKVHVIGEFLTAAQVFRQRFSADRSIQIESIEVRNSQNVLIESRLQQIAPEQFILFFKNPVTGKYTVTARGFCETEIQEERVVQSVPMLTFNEVHTKEHFLNLFRTSAVISEITSEQNGWSKTGAIPIAPVSFTQTIPLGNWQKNTATESMPAETETQPEPFRFVLSSNHPKVKCKSVLSLHANADAQWMMTLDFNGRITDGELKSLAFRWDERFGIIQSVEPPTPWTIEHFGGQQMFILTPAEPMQREQRFKITLSLTGTTVVLPNMFPLPRGIDQLESELFVNLPFKQENELIPWELKMLEASDDHVTDDARLVYRAVDTGFSATISQTESRLTATLYDIAFLIKMDGTMLGVATIDLKNRGQDSLLLQMPIGYEPIQISSAGTILDQTRFEESHQWTVNIGTSDYPQRLSIFFRASLPHTIRQWNREQIAATLRFPVLVGVSVQETLWTVAMEKKVPTMSVETVRESVKKNSRGDHRPLFGREATLSLVGVNLIREYNLLHVLRSLPVSLRQEEMQKWFSHWSDEWNTVADKVDSQIAYLLLQDIKPKLITSPVDQKSKKTEIPGTIRSFWETMSARTPESLRALKRESIQEKIPTAMETQSAPTGPILASPVYWQGRLSNETHYFFGTEEGTLRSIRLISKPDDGDWMRCLAEFVWLGICFALLIPIFVLLSVRWVHPKELWLQFPHFWGMTVGVLLWTFLPESFIGLIIIVLTFISFFRPSWTRHRIISKPY